MKKLVAQFRSRIPLRYSGGDPRNVVVGRGGDSLYAVLGYGSVHGGGDPVSGYTYDVLVEVSDGSMLSIDKCHAVPHADGSGDRYDRIDVYEHPAPYLAPSFPFREAGSLVGWVDDSTEVPPYQAVEQSYTFAAWHADVMNTLQLTGDVDRDAYHMAFGLGEEAGEVLGHFKRILRGDDGSVSSPVTTDDRRAQIGKELGDVLWYVDALATTLGLNLEQVARGTAMKLADRKARGVLKGSGDSR